MSRSILVVDDEQAIRDLVVFRLEASGFQVDSAENGAQALAKIQNSSPDLVVLDVMMPGIDGLEVCRQLKAENPEVKVVMLSAKGNQQAMDEGLAAGADKYLAKPFRAADLIGEVEALLKA